ncbi:hypothetical protein [Pseudomonas mediterranea]|uniref:Lipoprotein n=1 Tax=Pseudomonas mediterranea TaxID=183795 RepID=A0AAX2DGI9_9PSED|nr:hypothetical protein [Pseudomonas mediterranea]KGU87189.1 hypothetical protein N005_01130 [Pseudomonas mediterranea CFBP 5447]SDU61397.1 hypothetical protein SAMN05216476_3647 [Pseudomonas mediterranea]
MKLFVGVVAVALLVGCATSPTPSSKAVQAPAGQLSAYQAKPSGAYGTLQVIRDSGQTGSLCSMAIFINGKQAAKLDPGQKASFYLPPDSVSVGAAYTGSGICAMGAERVEREAIVKDGTVKKYRIFTGGDGQIDILPTTL